MTTALAPAAPEPSAGAAGAAGAAGTDEAPAAPETPQAVPAARRRRIALPWLGIANAAVLAALLAIGLITRLYGLRWSGGLNADEAVPGLMALHILSRGDLPVFYYGQHYFGALESYVIAAVFKLAGFQPRLVFLPPLLASLLLIPLTAALARLLVRGASPAQRAAAGWLAALPVAAATPLMARMLAHAGGGFALAYCLQGIALYCALRTCTGSPSPRASAWWAAGFSLAAGFLCWIWQPSLALTAVLLAVLLLRRPGLPFLAILPLALGLLPPLLYNWQNGFPTVAEILRKASTPPDQAPAEITQSPYVIPILLAMALGGGEDTLGMGNRFQAGATAVAVTCVLLAALLTTIISLARAIIRRAARPRTTTRTLASSDSGPAVTPITSPPARGPAIDPWVALILALAVATNVVAAHGAARHLHPAALIAFAFLGALPVALFGRARWLRLPRLALGLTLAGLVVVPNLWHEARLYQVYDEKPAFGAALDTVVTGLRERGLRRGYADYWTAFPVTYWSGEEIVVASIAPMPYGGRFDRYPLYVEHVNAELTFNGLFLLLDVACPATAFTPPLTEAGATFRVEPLGPYTLLWDVRVPPEREAETVDRWRSLIATRDTC